MRWYKIGLDGEPVQCKDPREFIEWKKENPNGGRIGLNNLSNEVKVSTVFLGLDHGNGSDPPVLWETMIFGGPHNYYQERYQSKEHAEEGHLKAISIASGQVVLPDPLEVESDQSSLPLPQPLKQ